MAAKSVQISLDEDLLRKVDRHPEVRKKGRSAFIRKALELLLDLDRRRKVDGAYARGYSGKADELADELAGLGEAQSWMEE
jgi:metal-responsive CopG/Arc/MetJ family transcriptional regulator